MSHLVCVQGCQKFQDPHWCEKLFSRYYEWLLYSILVTGRVKLFFQIDFQVNQNCGLGSRN
jgi:hypothetical protein